MPDYVKVFTIKGGDGQERRMELPLQLDVDRPKRPRTTFHADQLQALEMAFQIDGYPNAEKRARLAKELRLSDTQVKVWFQNRRTKGRKQGGGLEKAKESPKPPETPRSFDGRLDLETLPEAHDEEAEEARLEAEEKRASEVRLRADPPDAREENNNQVDARCGERSKDTIRRPSHGTVRSIARHLSEKQKTRTVEERARLAKHRMSMPEQLPPFPASPQSSANSGQMNSTRDSTSQSAHSGAPLLDRSPSQFFAGAGGLRQLHPASFMMMPPQMRPDGQQFQPMAPMHYPGDFQPVWYPMPAPMFVPLGPPMMHPKFQAIPAAPPSRTHSFCRELCCGGCAQLLWTIICIILMGIIAALLLTLFVV
ncbi:unnamed protein product, partial [Mesorhabditis spiculigera]